LLIILTQHLLLKKQYEQVQSSQSPEFYMTKEVFLKIATKVQEVKTMIDTKKASLDIKSPPTAKAAAASDDQPSKPSEKTDGDSVELLKAAQDIYQRDFKQPPLSLETVWSVSKARYGNFIDNMNIPDLSYKPRQRTMHGCF
jgi:hypothetical protein